MLAGLHKTSMQNLTRPELRHKALGVCPYGWIAKSRACGDVLGMAKARLPGQATKPHGVGQEEFSDDRGHD